jgi:hypothetical protein
MQESEGTRSVVDVHRLRAAVFGGSRRKRLPARRHARSGRVLVLVKALAPVLLAVGGLGTAVLLGIRWAEVTAPPPPREVSVLPVRPAEAAAPLTPIPLPAKGEADAIVHGAGRPGQADWAGVLRGLDRQRASAFGSGQPARLGGVYQPGSAAWREDVADLARLRAAGLRAQGLRLVVTSVAVRQVAQGRVVLDVVDRMPSYELVDAEGRVVRRDPGRGDRLWQVTLVPADEQAGAGAWDATAGWRIAHVVADRDDRGGSSRS